MTTDINLRERTQELPRRACRQDWGYPTAWRPAGEIWHTQAAASIRAQAAQRLRNVVARGVDPVPRFLYDALLRSMT